MNPFDHFETQEDLEVNGKWANFGSYKVLIARTGGKNTSYSKTLNDELKKLGKATADMLTGEELEELLFISFVKACIKDHQIKQEDDSWKSGIYIKEDNKVKVVSFNSKNMALCFKQLPDYYEQVEKIAKNFATFKAEVEEEQVKK